MSASNTIELTIFDSELAGIENEFQKSIYFVRRLIDAGVPVDGEVEISISDGIMEMSKSDDCIRYRYTSRGIIN